MLLNTLFAFTAIVVALDDPELVAIEGVVTYTGRIPEPVPVPEAGTVRHLVELDPRTKGLKDAVVWLEGVKPPVDGPKREQEKPLQMDQQNYFFIPHVMAIEAGREVEFLNSDAANHGVMATAFEAGNSFNMVTPPGGSYKHRFQATKRPIPIGCPIHASMAAWVVVFDHPNFAVTDKLGKFRIRFVPPGRYTLTVRHLDGGLEKKQDVLVRGDSSPKILIPLSETDAKIGPALKRSVPASK